MFLHQQQQHQKINDRTAQINQQIQKINQQIQSVPNIQALGMEKMQELVAECKQLRQEMLDHKASVLCIQQETQAEQSKRQKIEEAEERNEQMVKQSALPKETAQEQSALPKETAQEQIAVPKEAVLEQSSVPKEGALEQSSLPTETHPLEQSSLPAETVLEQISLPTKIHPLEQSSLAKESPSLEQLSSSLHTALPESKSPVQREQRSSPSKRTSPSKAMVIPQISPAFSTPPVPSSPAALILAPKTPIAAKLNIHNSQTIILAHIKSTSSLSVSTSSSAKITIEDAEVDEETNTKTQYTVLPSQICPLATSNAEALAKLAGTVAVGDQVLALYPDSTCFYNARIVSCPSNMNKSSPVGAGSSSKKAKDFLLEFEDDYAAEDSKTLLQRFVEPRFILKAF